MDALSEIGKIIKDELDNDFSIYAIKETELYSSITGIFYVIETAGFISKTFSEKMEKHNLKIFAIIDSDTAIEIRFLLRSKDKESGF